MVGDRALSTTVSYTLLIAITFALVGGLIVGTDTLIRDQRQQASQDQLELTTQELSSLLKTADRLADSNSRTNTLEITYGLKRRVAGSQYVIVIDEDTSWSGAGTRYEIRLLGRDFDGSTRTVITMQNTEIDLQGGPELRVNGGPLRIDYDQSSNELVLIDA